MKIKALHISAFGGLKNFNIQFENSFDVIYGENEHGKTTLMNFIKMMFYGTERSSSQLNRNLRKKYFPWDGSQPAGSIDFEKNNRSYTLERIFGNSNSTDKVTLIDRDLGTCENVSPDIGIKIFGISVSAFERSIFIGQFGFPENNSIACGELNGKLSNIALTGDENVSFEQVQKHLENAKFELMSKSGRSGIYDKNLKLRENLEQKLKTCELNEENIKKATELSKQIAEEIKILQKKADDLKVKIERENDIKNAKKLQELLNLKSRLDSLNQTLTLSDGSLADDVFVKKIEFCLSKIENIRNKISQKENEIAILKNNLNLANKVSTDNFSENGDKITEKINSLQNKKEKISLQIQKLTETENTKINPLYTVFTAITAAISIILFVLKPQFGILSGAILLLAAIISVVGVLRLKINKRSRQNEILNLKLEETRIISLIVAEKANLTAIGNAINANSALTENQNNMLKTGISELENLKANFQNENQALLNLFSAFKPIENTDQIDGMLAEIRENAEKQKEIKQNINYILKDIGNISYETAQKKLKDINFETKIDFAALKTEYEELLQTITERKTEFATINAEIKSLTANTENSENLKSEIENLTEKINSQKDYCECIDIVLSSLSDAYAQLRKNYGSVFENRAGEILSGITGGDYGNLSISKSFDITVEKNGTFGTKELDYLSSGTVDQAYLSLRMALSELISEEEQKLPVILDDSLTQYDDTRVKIALEFLKEYSENGQIIMFTCHRAIADIAKENGAKLITI